MKDSDIKKFLDVSIYRKAEIYKKVFEPTTKQSVFTKCSMQGYMQRGNLVEYYFSLAILRDQLKCCLF